MADGVADGADVVIIVADNEMRPQRGRHARAATSKAALLFARRLLMDARMLGGCGL